MYIKGGKSVGGGAGADDGFPCSCTPNVDLASSPGSQEGPTSSPRQSAAGNRRRGALNVPQCVPHDSLLLLCVCVREGVQVKRYKKPA